jgi:hypothetical protein
MAIRSFIDKRRKKRHPPDSFDILLDTLVDQIREEVEKQVKEGNIIERMMEFSKNCKEERIRIPIRYGSNEVKKP